MKYFIILYRSIFFYLLVAGIYRFMGKREIGELSIMDFIVSIFIAEIVALAIEKYNQSMLISLIPIAALVFLQVLSAYLSMHHASFRSFLDGKPSVMIEKGKVNFQEMKRQRYNLDDLLTQLRGNSVKSIEDVDYAVLETNGKLSIFLKKEDPNGNDPLPLVVDGKLDEETLKRIHKSKDWFLQELEKQNISMNQVFYCFYKNQEFYIIENNTIK